MNPNAQLLTRRIQALGAIQPIDFLDRIMPAIRSWLFELLREELPSKRDVLDWISEALRAVLESHEFPFADEFLDVAIREAVVTLAGAGYDQLVDLTKRPAI